MFHLLGALEIDHPGSNSQWCFLSPKLSAGNTKWGGQLIIQMGMLLDKSGGEGSECGDNRLHVAWHNLGVCKGLHLLKGLRIDIERQDIELRLWFAVLHDGARSGANKQSDISATIVRDVRESTGAVAISNIDDAGKVARATVDSGGSDGIDVEGTSSNVKITGRESIDGDDTGSIVRVALALSASDGTGVEGMGDVDKADIVVEVVVAIAGIGISANGIETPVL